MANTARHSRQGANPRFLREISTTEALIAQRGVAMNEFVRIETDFLQKAGSTPILPWTATKTGTSTNDTIDFVANTADGLLKFTHSADSEAQTMRVDWGDQLLIPVGKLPRMEAKLKIDITGANLAATSRLVCGFASAYNATLNNVVTNAWFRFGDGTNLKIFVEGDDGTTDTDLQDSGLLWVDNTFLILEVGIDAAKVAHFLVNGASAGQVSLAALAGTEVLQPIIAIQRDSGTAQNLVYIDYVQCTWTRS